MYSAVPIRQGGTIANFEEKVPPQNAHLALLMYDNLTPVYIKFRNIPSQYTYLYPPRLLSTAE